MSQKTAEKFQDFYVWFTEHKNDHGGVPERLAFLEKAMDVFADTVLYALEDITDLEGRPKESIGRRLWTVNGMNLRGDVKRFG